MFPYSINLRSWYSIDKWPSNCRKPSFICGQHGYCGCVVVPRQRSCCAVSLAGLQFNLQRTDFKTVRTEIGFLHHPPTTALHITCFSSLPYTSPVFSSPSAHNCPTHHLFSSPAHNCPTHHLFSSSLAHNCPTHHLFSSPSAHNCPTHHLFFFITHPKLPYSSPVFLHNPSTTALHITCSSSPTAPQLSCFSSPPAHNCPAIHLAS